MSLPGMGHDIRWGRRYGDENDRIYTPTKLAAKCVGLLSLSDDVSTLDPCRGLGAFYDQLPNAEWCEVDEGRDFFDWHKPVDWVVSNPPYSMLDSWLDHTAQIASVGFAYLLSWHALTPSRLERLESQGFGLIGVTLFKVFAWYGMTAWAVWERGAEGIIQYDRNVWR